MVKKLRLNEDVNKASSEVYENIVLLGYAAVLAANDFHHIHLCTIGDKFQEIHSMADQYQYNMRNLADFCFEVAKESDIKLMNETYALQILSDEGVDWAVSEADTYRFEDAYNTFSNILSDIAEFITEIENTEGITSDLISSLDNYLRDFTKDVNYFIPSRLK